MKSFLFVVCILIISHVLLLQAQEESQIQAGGDGLTGYYYENYAIIDSSGVIDTTGLTLSFTRVDTVIDFWNGAAQYSWQPVPGWGNYYTVQWQGYIYTDTTGRYGFGTISDDGSQIWIDDSLILDNGNFQWYDWEDNISEGDTAGTSYPPLLLDSGFHKIEVRFFEDVSLDGIELWWLQPAADSSDIPYYGTNFHDIAPTYNVNTNWSIIPKNVLFTEIDTTTSINYSEQYPLPNAVQLLQNYPNPFNANTTIEFLLHKPGFVTLKMYDLSGKLVSTLVANRLGSGTYKYNWDAADLASGVYVYRIDTDAGFQIKKALMLK